MPKDRTPEAGVPWSTRISRYVRGSRGDVELPMPAGGRRDRRLPEKPDVLGSLREAKKGLTKVREISGRR
jgi:hypothetical protein